MCELLGIPLRDQDQFRAWATDIVAAADIGVPYGTFRRAEIATRAPNAVSPTAMPRPMPAPPPVTTATRSVRSTLEGSSAMKLNIEQSHVKVYSSH